MRKTTPPHMALLIASLKVSAGFGAVLMLSACNSGLMEKYDISLPALGSQQRSADVTVPRPPADSSGVIHLANQQAVLAQNDDTPARIAQRLGMNAAALARLNALNIDTALPQGVLLVLPATSPSTRADAGNLPAVRLHRVQQGETAWSIARKYQLPVTELAAWNSLPVSMALRIGQALLIPPIIAKPAEEVVSIPGAGSASPQPPSAALALPGEKPLPPGTPVATTAAPDLGATRTAASLRRNFALPAEGPIVRAYQKGVNEGIDIRSQAGAAVRAASAGKVVAISKDTAGGVIIAVQHNGDLVTLYAGLQTASVSNGATVKAGTILGRTGPTGMLHFEIRKGMNSVDPAEYL